MGPHMRSRLALNSAVTWLAGVVLATFVGAQSPARDDTRATHPLLGLWRQSGWKPCKPVAQMTAENVDPFIQELEFRADGTFSVTWQPFERYTDYWGQYRYSTASRVLDMHIEHGNFVPKDFAGHGTAIVSGDTLTLRDVRLGTKQATARPAMCELSFVRAA